MTFENLLYEKKDSIARVTFNRPKVLNALNRKTVGELREAPPEGFSRKAPPTIQGK